MVPNLAFVVTEGCDLPTAFYDQHPVFIIPVQLKTKQQTLAVDRNVSALHDFYLHTDSLENTDIIGADKTAIRHLLLDNLIYHFDNVLFIAPANAFSHSLQHIRETLLENHLDIEPLRKAASINRPFRSRIIESSQMIAGYGAVLHHGIALSQTSNSNLDALRAAIENYDAQIDQYALLGHKADKRIKDLFNLPWWVQKKHQLTNTEPVFRYHHKTIRHVHTVKKEDKYRAFFELIADNISSAPTKPHLVNVSYSGSLAKIRTLPGYFAFHEYLGQLNIKVLHSMMSRSAASMVGLDAIAIACKT